MKGASRCQPGFESLQPALWRFRRAGLGSGQDVRARRNSSLAAGITSSIRSRASGLAVYAASAVGLIFPFLRSIGIDAFGNGVAVNAESGSGVRNALAVARIGL